MSRRRIPKTMIGKVSDLDSHLYLLRTSLIGLSESESYAKSLSAELRVLICKSSGTEGLIWRLLDEFGLDDKLWLHVPGDLDTGHPLADGLMFSLIPLRRGGFGPPELPPDNYSFKDVIRDCQAVIAHGKPLTHEQLIKAVAQQMGSAHEDDGLDLSLAYLRSIFIGGVSPYLSIMATDAELTLEVGERIIEFAEKERGYTRQIHSHNYGDFSFVSCITVKECPEEVEKIFELYSFISDKIIEIYLERNGIRYKIFKNSVQLGEIIAEYSDIVSPEKHSVFVFSYCSRAREARTIVNGRASRPIHLNAIGWLFADEFNLSMKDVNSLDLLERHYALTYARLLSSKDCRDLSELPSNGYGLWKFHEQEDERGTFPD